MTADDKNLLRRIKHGQQDHLPYLRDAKLVRCVRDQPNQRTWHVYIAHDRCHDRENFRDDRNTVLALSDHGQWRIIGRELDTKLANEIASGEAPYAEMTTVRRAPRVSKNRLRNGPGFAKKTLCRSRRESIKT